MEHTGESSIIISDRKRLVKEWVRNRQNTKTCDGGKLQRKDKSERKEKRTVGVVKREETRDELRSVSEPETEEV